jgi:hypothetical protein
MLVTPLGAAEPLTQEIAAKLQDILATARPNFSCEGIQNWEELAAKYKEVFAVENSDFWKTECIIAGDA